MRLLEMLVGDENTHSTSLENICENRFEVANLYNKRLVICPDEDRRIRGLSVFKSVTGGDSLRGEEKGIKAFKFKFQGMVTLASNTPIFMGDDSYGLSRRLIAIPFAHTIPKAERRDLTAEFTADLPAFTTYLLGLDRDWVTDTLRQANDLKAIKDLEWEMTIRTDSIAAFYEEKLIYDPKLTEYDGDKLVYERDWVTAANAYKSYREFCADTGFAPKHQNNFAPSLVNLLVDKLEKDVKSRRTNIGRVFEGLRLRTIGDPIGDGVTAVTTILEKTEKNKNESSTDLSDGVTAVTAKTEKQFSLENSPKPPTIDRPIPKTTKVDDYVEYLLVGDKVEWLEIAFHQPQVAQAWGREISKWGAKVQRPHTISRDGFKYILRVKNISLKRVNYLLTLDLMSSPRQPTHR
jgi:Family of unknown function (DUF5906)